MIVVRGNTFKTIDDCNEIVFTNKEVIPSKYNLYKIFDGEKCVIFNTLYESIVILDKRELNLYFSIKDGRKLDNEFLKKMYYLGFLKFKTDCENDLVESLKNDLFFIKNSKANVTILPTQNCNARCLYCFADHNEKISMKQNNVNQIVKYFVDNFSDHNKVIIRWFGGEPLIEEKTIDAIIDGLNAAFEDKLIIESIMFTNGALLDDRIIQLAKKRWHLKKIQLTIDGYDYEHNYRKNYVTSDAGVNYYHKIIEDISKLLKNKISVDCRVNLDKDNIAQLDLILNDLSQFKDNTLFRVRVTFLRPSSSETNKFNFIKPSELKWAYEIIYKKLFSYGFIKDIKEILPCRQKESCIAKNMNKVIIGADGNLYKCLQQILNEENSVGNLESGLRPIMHMNCYHTKEFRNECKPCIFLPLCMGGCEAYWELQKKGIDITPCIREKFFFDMLLEFIYKYTCSNCIY